jgi:hypothetical protein
VRVEIHDFAGLGSSTLVDVSNRTASILAKAGVAAQVEICRGEGAIVCERDRESDRRFLIRVLPGEAKHRKQAGRVPLGQSFIGQAGGVYASVFVEPIQDTAAEANVPWTLVLAYASAHEVGHLLRGNENHTANGLMKGTWSQKDFQAMAQDHLNCSLLPVTQSHEAKGSRETTTITSVVTLLHLQQPQTGTHLRQADHYFVSSYA